MPPKRAVLDPLLMEMNQTTPTATTPTKTLSLFSLHNLPSISLETLTSSLLSSCLAIQTHAM
ncbi:hypothetical protein PGTUg99_011409 [Puccinia graminis f. sp. tritici]|uniref:Uncharacterized protein n=1 Tax=Puccinia graminis f. sp. tritici TaxID=56615 RepID=A0A5B0RVN1_PUCGR|nr:hypothetical protein PGTUg99_011409 [Puccinia graminis f. sp. tritici]